MCLIYNNGHVLASPAVLPDNSYFCCSIKADPGRVTDDRCRGRCWLAERLFAKVAFGRGHRAGS